MGVTPFRVRITAPGAAPGWLRDGTGERLLQTFGLMVDARMERLTQGMLAHMPRSTIANHQAAYDALLVMASDRLITPGATETGASLSVREQRAFDDWQLAGLPWGVLSPVLGALLSYTPSARTVATTFDPSSFPPTRVSSAWETYVAGDPFTTPPAFAYGVASGDGDFDWDSLSPITGSWGSWSGYVIVYSVAPNDWAPAPQNWGDGSVYTPSVDGYYSTAGAVGGIPAYVPSGSYAGTTRAWGAGSTYVPGTSAIPGTSGYYSTAGASYGAPAYVPLGYYVGSTNGWGVEIDVSVGQNLAVTIAQRKPANVWVRSIVVSRDASLFDPSQPAGGGVNPDGYFGQWSKAGTVGGIPAYVSARFDNAIYGSEVR